MTGEGHEEHGSEAIAAAGPATSPEDALAVAEEAAAREAAEEAAGPGTDAEAGAATRYAGAKVVRPKARTSRKSAARDDGANDAASATNGPSAASSTNPDVTVIGPDRASAGRLLGPMTVHQGGIQEAHATTIDISQGGIGRAHADDIAVSQGGVGFARGDRVSVEMGAIGAAIAGEVRVTQGAAGNVLAREVRIEQAGVRTIVANQVHVERTTGVLLLIARRVEGDVRAVLDWRGALAFGAAFGVIVSLFRRRGR